MPVTQRIPDTPAAYPAPNLKISLLSVFNNDINQMENSSERVDSSERVYCPYLSSAERHRNYKVSIEAPKPDIYTYYWFLNNPDTLQLLNGRPYPDTSFSNFLKFARIRQPGRTLKPDVVPEIGFRELRMESHTSGDLASSLVEYILPKNSLFPYQQQAVLDFTQLRLTYSPRSTRVAQSIHYHQFVLSQYYEVFDDVFFMGGLRKLCKIEFFHENQGRLELFGRCMQPLTLRHGDSTRRYAQVIQIFSPRNQPLDEPKYKNYMRPLLCTLLHEMLHAFFRIYVHSSAPIGHGWQWQIAAHHIQIAAEGYWGGVWYLGRTRIWHREYMTSRPVDDGTLVSKSAGDLWDSDRLAYFMGHNI